MSLYGIKHLMDILILCGIIDERMLSTWYVAHGTSEGLKMLALSMKPNEYEEALLFICRIFGISMLSVCDMGAMLCFYAHAEPSKCKRLMDILISCGIIDARMSPVGTPLIAQ